MAKEIEDFPPESTAHEFTLCKENAPGDFSESNFLEFLMNLQDRDITPEDYELLLRLDESVPTKTISDERIASFETENVSERHVNETCGICMEGYVVGQSRKILPYKHIFHVNCIDTWLKNSSTKCPLDNKEV